MKLKITNIKMNKYYYGINESSIRFPLNLIEKYIKSSTYAQIQNM